MATIQHGYLQIHGLFGPFVAEPPDSANKLTKFPGLRGASELRLGDGTRLIELPAWLFNEYTASQLLQHLRELDVATGNVHGTLSIPASAGVPRTENNCTFLGFTRDRMGMLPDVAGTLGTAGKYWIGGVLRWRQLVVSLQG